MEWRLRQEIEDALWAAARSQIQSGALERKRLLRAITERSALYTSERDVLRDLGASAMPQTDLAARALFFTVADAAKISIPLRELAGRGLLPTGQTWQVLDLGAGAGAMGLGLISFVSQTHPGLGLQLDAVDRDTAALEIYSDAVRCIDKAAMGLGPLRINTTQASTADFAIKPGHYDFVVLGSVLNELDAAARVDLAERAMRGVKPGGALIVIEPALRETSRALHRVRDALIGSGTSIFAPCTRTHSPCAALADERDWCHEDRPGVLPTRARQMAQSTGLRDGGLKFSYLTARHDSEPLVELRAGEAALRVVSQPQRSKGQRECFACGEIGRQRVRLLKRNRSGANRIVERARRGDVLLMPALEEKCDRIEIARTDEISLRRPAEREE